MFAMFLSRRIFLRSTAAGLLAAGVPAFAADAEPAHKLVGDPTFLIDKGVGELEVESPSQHGRNVIRILVPEKFKPADPHRVLYLLPVEENLGTRWGDPMNEMIEKGLQ